MDLVVCQNLTKKAEYRRHLPHSLSEKTTLVAGTVPLDSKFTTLAGTRPAQKPTRLATAAAVWKINNRCQRETSSAATILQP
ncbi:hypothetical protein GMOD_00001053 [Pyrenophora seminiperda CCB06]|uniref:Uncharacterized protein n=1 Tax=Pyrenophora seminiperda CCB06 TaxID=1302712 RepID=A0A3M7LY38_9PLEO|nr:hypothetical protein GMOD_00001053 [Pyrenophora seminiperda CCB06]